MKDFLKGMPENIYDMFKENEKGNENEDIAEIVYSCLRNKKDRFDALKLSEEMKKIIRK